MHRKKLAKNNGMLFKFPYEDNLCFWMKNTYLPLNIAFLDNSGKILQIEDMAPLSTRTVRANNKCKYALEVNKGWFKDNGVNVGAIIGGIEFKKNVKISQGMPPLAPEGQMPQEGLPQQPQQPQENAQPQPNPDVQLNMTHEEVLKDADLNNKKLTIIYQKKDGFVLPPKTISPPFLFEKDEEGERDALLKAWDDQNGSWKSFLIDNIISLEEEGKDQEKEEGISNTNLEKENIGDNYEKSI